MALSWLGSRCGTRTKAMPNRAGKAFKSCMNASRPPADAPTPTMGKARRLESFKDASAGILETTALLLAAFFGFLVVLERLIDSFVAWRVHIIQMTEHEQEVK